MRNELGKISYRLTDRGNKISTFGGRNEICKLCKEKFRAGEYVKHNPTCPECMRKDQGSWKLGKRQKLYVSYLLLITKRQQYLVDSRDEGKGGILVTNDLKALEWQILEYRRVRTMQRLGLMIDFTPTLRKRARLAIKLMNEIRDFNLKMMFREE